MNKPTKALVRKISDCVNLYYTDWKKESIPAGKRTALVVKLFAFIKELDIKEEPGLSNVVFSLLESRRKNE